MSDGEDEVDEIGSVGGGGGGSPVSANVSIFHLTLSRSNSSRLGEFYP